MSTFALPSLTTTRGCTGVTSRTREVTPVQPRVVVSGGSATVLMPGDPGYDD